MKLDGHGCVVRRNRLYSMTSNLTPKVASIIVSAGVATGLVSGLFASALTQVGLYPYVLIVIVVSLNFLLPNIVEFYQVRQRAFVTGIAVCSCAIGIGTMHFSNYRYFIHHIHSSGNRLQAENISSFFDFMSKRRRRELPTQNRASDFYYSHSTGQDGAIEFLAIFLTAACLYRMTHKPDCLKCNSWLEKYELGTVCTEFSQIVTEIKAGNYKPITPDLPRVGMRRLSVLLCPKCESVMNFLIEISDLSEKDHAKRFEESKVYLFVTKAEFLDWLQVFSKPQIEQFVRDTEITDKETA